MNEDILVKVGADISDLTSSLSAATRDLNSFGANMKDIGGGVAKTFGAATIAIGGGLAYAVNKAADFDSQMRKAGAIAGASAKELDAMRDAALDLGAKTSESASSVATAMTEMAAKGFNANQTIAAMPGIIAAAEASGEDLALAADTVSSALNIWGLEAAESAKVADVLAMSANVSAAGIDDLGYVLKYAGGPAAALGISLEEVAAAAGIMTNAGLDGSNAGTALRASLLALNNPAKAQEKMMANLGISMRDAEGNAVSLSEMVQNLTEATAHMTEADRVATLGKLVGTEAVSGFLALMKAGPAEIDKMTVALENSGGASAEAAAQMKAGIGGALENLSGSLESLAITLGDQLVPYVQSAAEWLAGLAEKFTNLSEGTKKFLVVGTAIAGIFSAIATGIGIAMVVIGNIIGAMSALAGALGITGGAAGLLSAAIAAITGPIGIAVAAITGIIAVVVLAYNKIEWFRNMVNAAWTNIKEATSVAFTAIKEVIAKVVSGVVTFAKSQLDKFKAFWDENGKAIMIIVKSYFTYISEIIKGVMGVIKGLFQTVWPLISNTVRYAWETIKLVISTALDIVLGVIQTVMKVLQGDWKGAWETIYQTLKNIWSNVVRFLKNIDLKQTGKDIIQGLINGIGSMGGAIVGAVKNIVGNIGGTVKSLLDIHSPSRVMRDLGRYTGEGLALGIADMKGAVAKSASLLANVATPTLSYDTPSVRGASNSAISKLETNLQTQFDEAEANRGDLVLVMDSHEVARISKPHLDGMSGKSLNLALYSKGARS